MNDVLKTMKIRGVVIMVDDRFKSLTRDGHTPRRTLRHAEQSFEEIYVEEIQPGDNVIFAAISDDPKEPNRIISAHIATDLQPKAGDLISDGGAKEVTISFTGIQTPTPTEKDTATRYLKQSRFGEIENLYPETPTLFDQSRPLSEVLKAMGPMHLDPIERHVLRDTPFEYVIPLRGNEVLTARSTVEINGRTHLVIQKGDVVPPHRQTYLFISHDRNNQPTGGFILSGIFLSEYIHNLQNLPVFPANTKWLDRREAESVKFDFRAPGEPQDWIIIAVHAGEIVYNDPAAIVDNIGDKGTVFQPNTSIPDKAVNVLLMDYDTIPGFASRVYEASDVNLNRIIKDGRIDVKRPPNGLPGFLIDGVIFSETMPYTYQFYGNHTNYPRFRE